MAGYCSATKGGEEFKGPATNPQSCLKLGFLLG